MKLKHRVVVMYQNLKADREERETVGPWMTPAEAEAYSDKQQETLGEDPVRHILIEGNKPEPEAQCELSWDAPAPQGDTP